MRCLVPFEAYRNQSYCFRHSISSRMRRHTQPDGRCRGTTRSPGVCRLAHARAYATTRYRHVRPAGRLLPAYDVCPGIRAIDNSPDHTANSVASPAAGKDTGCKSDVSTCFDSYHSFPYPFRLEHPTPIARAPYQSLNISRSSRDVEGLFGKKSQQLAQTAI